MDRKSFEKDNNNTNNNVYMMMIKKYEDHFVLIKQLYLIFMKI